MNTNIYCITHKQFYKPELDEYIPLQVGCALSNDLGYLRDDKGDNISVKNKNYCELTGIYYLWKNVQCDIIGVCHYRRYFVYDENFLTKDKIEDILKRYDIIIPNSAETEYESLRQHYTNIHFQKDLNILEQVLAEIEPDYLQAYELCMSSNLFSIGNMMVCRKDIYDEYCSWLFPILFEVEKRADISEYDEFQARLFGYLSERLLRVWLLKQTYKCFEIEVRLMNPEDAENARKLGLMKKRLLEIELQDLTFCYANYQYMDVVDLEQIANRKVNDEKIPIFILWLQGLENAPEIVARCIKSIIDNSPTYTEVHILTNDNLFDYISLPDFIICKYNVGIINNTKLSNMIRCQLLYRYGGLWIDSTYFVQQSMDDNIFENDFWTIKLARSPWRADITEGRWSNNIFYCKKGNLLMRYLVNAFFVYWAKHDELIDYFIFDMFIAIAYENIDIVKMQIDAVPSSNPHVLDFVEILNERFDKTQWEELKSNTNFFKLTWKKSFEKKNIVDKKTFYGEICE